MSELELIIDLHEGTDRQGPGSIEETTRAFQLTDLSSTDRLKIADIGCGTGASTMTLASLTSADLIGVDLFSSFLARLDQNTIENGFAGRIQSLKASMDVLPFQEETFDLIWSEGAIYNMGFEKGIKEWRPFLKKGGFLAVSEITWITPTRPQEIEDYWNSHYPEIAMASEKSSILEKNGWSLTGYFMLNTSSWLDNYYAPIEANFENFLKRHDQSASAKAIVTAYKEEIQWFRRYKDFYNYGFYIAKKVD